MASNTAKGWLSVGQGWTKTSKAGRRLTASGRKPGSRRSTPLARDAQPLLLRPLAEDDDHGVRELAGRVDDQLGSLPVDQSHGAAQHRRRERDVQLGAGLLAREEGRQRDAVGDDLVAHVELVHADELGLGPFGGQHLHVDAAEDEAAEPPPHAAVRLGRQVRGGDHGGRAQRDGGHDGVLGRVRMREHGVEHHGTGSPDGAEGADEPGHVGVAADALEADAGHGARGELLLELVGHDAEHHRIESIPVEVVQETEQVTLHAAERVPLDEVDDPDGVAQVGSSKIGTGRRTPQAPRRRAAVVAPRDGSWPAPLP